MLHYAKYLLDGSEVQGWFLKFASAESTSLHSKLLDPPGFRVSLWGLGKLTQRIGSRENHPRSFHQFPQCTWNFPATVPWSQLRETSANAQKYKSLGKGTYPQEWRNTYIHTLHYNYNYIYILHLHLIFTLHYITYIHTDTHTHIYIYYTHTHLFPVKESQFHSDTGDIIAPGGEWREFLLYSAQDTSPSTANPEAGGLWYGQFPALVELVEGYKIAGHPI